MRFDNIGIFWQDDQAFTSNKNIRNRPLARIPETGWKAPKDFPNLFHEKILGLDVETFDPDLNTHGPGWARGVGHIIGISLATKDKAWYFPIRHETQPEDNIDPSAVFKYLTDLLALPMPKVGANIGYDSGWLKQERIQTNGILYDVLFGEAILNDTSKDLSLEAIAQKYLGHGKVSSQLYSWCARSFGGKPDGKQRKWMYKTPPSLAGPYAEADASEPLQILLKQRNLLVGDGLWDLFEMECKLIPVLQGMRFRGLPINEERAEKVEEELQNKINKSKSSLDKIAGFEVNVNANTDLVRLFDKFKIKYPFTEKGNASFTKKFLATNKTVVSKEINNIRKLEKIKVTFIRGAILDKHIDGRLFPSFHPLRGEWGGAVSGRFSSSMPNAQNIPARDEELGSLVRGLFVPENIFNSWIKFDLSQIEYRIFAHFSDDQNLINGYQDRTTDYHDVVSGFLNDLLIRKIIKNFNFMSLFGGGRDTTIDMIGESLTEEQILEMAIEFGIDSTNPLKALGNHFVDLYAEKFPAAKTTLQKYSDIANTTGEIRTLLNRKNTFNLWEPSKWSKHNYPALPLNRALEVYGKSIKRAGTYKALNRVTQGGSADLLKKGMLDAYEEGLFNSDRLGFPHVTVHDELDFSYHSDLQKDAMLLREIMENTIKLKVPVIMDIEVGTNWGNVKSVAW